LFVKSRTYVPAVLATAALTAAVALTVSWLGGYVAFEASPAVGDAVPPDRVVVVASPQRTATLASHTDADGPPPAAAPAVNSQPAEADASAASQPADDGHGGSATPPAGDDGGSGDGGGSHGPAPTAGDPPIADTPPEEAPTDSRTDPLPTDIEVPLPTDTTSSQAPGPLAQITGGVDQTLDSVGLDLPLQQLTAPATDPVDHLLEAVRGGH
jgi:hypothetical protein